MQHSSYPQDAIAFGRLRRNDPGCELDLSAYPKPRPLGPTPRFTPAARLSGRAAHQDLNRTLDRLRAARLPAGKPRPVHPIRLLTDNRLRRAERTQKIRDGVFNTLVSVAIAGIAFWVGAPVAAAIVGGL